MFTDDKQVVETEEYHVSAWGCCRCHYYNVQQDGTHPYTEGINDNDPLGNSSARFGLGTDERCDYEYSVPMTCFTPMTGATDHHPGGPQPRQITGVEVQSGPTFTDVSPTPGTTPRGRRQRRSGTAPPGLTVPCPEASMTYAEFLTVSASSPGRLLPPSPGPGTTPTQGPAPHP